MMAIYSPGRRVLLGRLAATGAGLLVPTLAGAAPQKAASKTANRKKEEPEEEVAPNEDLMREHGVLKRALLVYRECMRRIAARQDFPPDSLLRTANLIHTFVENYHEKIEEDYLFPRFRKANSMVDLVDTLERQHKAGRLVTDRVIAGLNGGALKDAGRRTQLNGWLASFVRMYEPHEAREDTVLFPAFKKIVSKHEYDALGEEFEDKEHKMFGEDGFEKNVAEIGEIEKTLGIYDLSQFTPKV
jgi:hemerythrin-like domain-containing protein